MLKWGANHLKVICFDVVVKLRTHAVGVSHFTSKYSKPWHKRRSTSKQNENTFLLFQFLCLSLAASEPQMVRDRAEVYLGPTFKLLSWHGLLLLLSGSGLLTFSLFYTNPCSYPPIEQACSSLTHSTLCQNSSCLWPPTPLPPPFSPQPSHLWPRCGPHMPQIAARVSCHLQVHSGQMKSESPGKATPCSLLI